MKSALVSFCGRSVIHQYGGSERAVLKQPQGSFNHGVLPGRVSGFVEWIAMLERHEQRPGRTNPFWDLAKELNDDGCDAAPFKFCCDQAHGLVAHGSHRHEQCDVHAVFGQPVGRLRHIVAHEATGRRDGTHERQVSAVQ